MPVANAEILLRIAECANRELTTVALPVSITAMVINWDHTPAFNSTILTKADLIVHVARVAELRPKKLPSS